MAGQGPPYKSRSRENGADATWPWFAAIGPVFIGAAGRYSVWERFARKGRPRTCVCPGGDTMEWIMLVVGLVAGLVIG